MAGAVEPGAVMRDTVVTHQTDYRATRPKVERKLGHLCAAATADAAHACAANARSTPTSTCWPPSTVHNLARLAVLGLRSTTSGWAAVSA
jgi:hypothetical protein